MNERILHLKIKIKALAAESVIIRAEARKTFGLVRQGLNEHRKVIVRAHTRSNLLAYGLRRGVPYRDIERGCKATPHWKAVNDISRRFGASENEVAVWISEAKAYIQQQIVPVKMSA